MGIRFETLGNATLQFFDGDLPVLVTDPWLLGTCYSGSWALEAQLSAPQIEAAAKSRYACFTHGRQHHLHSQSLKLLSRRTKVLVPEFYRGHVRDLLAGEGFEVTVLPYRRWMSIGEGFRVLCIDTATQDAILAIEAGDALVLDCADSQTAGEIGFLKSLVSEHRNDKTFLAALCAIDDEALTVVDAFGRHGLEPDEEAKAVEIRRMARFAARLGVKYYLHTSSQHIHVRADSAWANQYRITYPDLLRHWHCHDVLAIQPFVTVNLDTLVISRNKAVTEPDWRRVSAATGEDDHEERLSAEEWRMAESFIAKFETLKTALDFVRFTVGGESRRISLNGRARNRLEAKLRGIEFTVPRRSLVAAMESGRFGDLLLGHFMKTRLHNARLHPAITPMMAWVGGEAGVYTPSQWRQYRGHYLTRNPWGYLAGTAERLWRRRLVPDLRAWTRRLGLAEPLKRVQRRMSYGKF